MLTKEKGEIVKYLILSAGDQRMFTPASYLMMLRINILSGTGRHMLHHRNVAYS